MLYWAISSYSYFNRKSFTSGGIPPDSLSDAGVGAGDGVAVAVGVGDDDTVGACVDVVASSEDKRINEGFTVLSGCEVTAVFAVHPLIKTIISTATMERLKESFINKGYLQ
jgi:hypothetical protein